MPPPPHSTATTTTTTAAGAHFFKQPPSWKKSVGFDAAADDDGDGDGDDNYRAEKDNCHRRSNCSNCVSSSLAAVWSSNATHCSRSSCRLRLCRRRRVHYHLVAAAEEGARTLPFYQQVQQRSRVCARGTQPLSVVVGTDKVPRSAGQGYVRFKHYSPRRQRKYFFFLLDKHKQKFKPRNSIFLCSNTVAHTQAHASSNMCSRSPSL